MAGLMQRFKNPSLIVNLDYPLFEGDDVNLRFLGCTTLPSQNIIAHMYKKRFSKRGCPDSTHAFQLVQDIYLYFSGFQNHPFPFKLQYMQFDFSDNYVTKFVVLGRKN